MIFLFTLNKRPRKHHYDLNILWLEFDKVSVKYHASFIIATIIVGARDK